LSELRDTSEEEDSQENIIIGHKGPLMREYDEMKGNESS